MDAYDSVLGEIASNKEFMPEEKDSAGELLNEIDRDLLMEKLAGLGDALDTFEEDAVIPVIDELSVYLYKGESIKDRLEEISGLVQSFDFCSAADALEKLRKEWEDA